jgi:hypothetical protein
MKIFLGVFFSLVFLLFSSCEKDSGGNNEEPTLEGNLIFIDPAVEMQKIEGFGASDSWRVQFVGKNWPLEKRNAMADILFSKDLKEDGSPEGIGLSLWRFYIGAGSAEQGDASDIQNSWRRAECFLTEDGRYDWSKQQGQQWFLQAAKERGLESVLGYAISPPVHYTKNGKAYSPGGNNINLQAGRMADYAEFLATVSEYFQSQGIPFDYLSPVNEPQWDWSSSGQEGSPATNADIANVVRELSPKLKDKGLSTEIVVPEAAELQFLYGENGKPERQNQMEAFFSASSPHYIGNLDNVKDVALGHSYFTTAHIPTLVGVRQNLGSKVNTFGGAPGYWQSEFCILENTDDIGGGWERDLGIGTALYVARVIHFDLTLANARSWSWWTALSQYDYKDGLIYLDNGNDGINGPNHPNSETLKMDGFYRESKLLWAFGNYSRFIRPGMVRIKSGFSIPKSEDLQASNLMFSAYKDSQSGKLVVVFVNYSASDKKVHIGNLGEAFSIEDNIFESYTTSDTQDLQKGTMAADQITIGKRSVVTLVGMMK